MTVLERIKYLAEKRGKTLRQVTDDLKFSENYLYTLKTKTPNGQTLEKLADYFHISVDFLLGREANYTFDDYPFEVSVTQDNMGGFVIMAESKKATPQELLQKIEGAKIRIETRLNFAPEFNIDDPVWTTFRVEQLFIDDLIEKEHIQVVALKKPINTEPVDLADLVDDSKVNWDEWVSFNGKPLSDEVKNAMKLILGKRLED